MNEADAQLADSCEQVKFTEDQLVRFWSKVAKAGPHECWEWTAYRSCKGYGQFRINGMIVAAHRVSWWIKFGQIADDLWVLHHCDNPPCVNPHHLWLGTNTENQRDMISKRRGPDMHGEKHPSAKLENEQIIEIRRRYEQQRLQGSVYGFQRFLAKEYGVARNHIDRIVSRKSWSHI